MAIKIKDFKVLRPVRAFVSHQPIMIKCSVPSLQLSIGGSSLKVPLESVGERRNKGNYLTNWSTSAHLVMGK